MKDQKKALVEAVRTGSSMAVELQLGCCGIATTVKTGDMEGHYRNLIDILIEAIATEHKTRKTRENDEMCNACGSATWDADDNRTCDESATPNTCSGVAPIPYEDAKDEPTDLTEANQTINAMQKHIGELDAELMKANTDLSRMTTRVKYAESGLEEERQKNHDTPQTIRSLATRLDQLTIRMAATEKTQMGQHGAHHGHASVDKAQQQQIEELRLDVKGLSELIELAQLPILSTESIFNRLDSADVIHQTMQAEIDELKRGAMGKSK